MLTQKQLRLLEPFQKNVFLERTYKELKTFSREKSNSVMQRAVKQFKAEGLIKERSLGTSKLYTLNLSNEKIFLYLELLSQDRLPAAAKKSLAIIREELAAFPFCSLVIFGSFAEGKANDSSDLDLAVFIPDKTQKKDIEIALHSGGNKTILKLDYHVITAPEMLEMLRASYQNVGKEIASKNLPVSNSQTFYSLIITAKANGYTPLS